MVNRALESRIDWDRFAVKKAGHTTLVKPFPISVAFPEGFQDGPFEGGSREERSRLAKDTGIKTRFLGVGVERMDYTKGVLERFHGIERFLEIVLPHNQGEFTFVQLGAPSRTHIKRYHDFLEEVEQEAERINWKFKSKDYKPIVFLKKHHSHEEILPFYRMANVCVVPRCTMG